MSKKNIIDDDTRLRNLLGKYLGENNFEVFLAQDTAQGRKILSSKNVDLIIVDVMMKGETGIEFTDSFSKDSDIPILILTARGDSNDRISGLKAGAQDYLSKPFEPQELLLRINNIANLNVRASKSIQKEACAFGRFSFNFEKQSLQKDSQFIHLTDSEKNILAILCRNIDDTLSRDNLAKYCGDLDHRSIDVQITRLRKKIELNPKQPQFLQTIRNQGYILRS